jgi:Bacterial Ig-like domain (group 3)
VTATVTSSKPITGTVIFTAAQFEEFPYPNGVPVLNGVASYTVNVGQGSLQFPVGTFNITAQYSGDANNQPSQSVTGVNEVFTGTTLITIRGQTGSLSHEANVAITLQ